MFTFKKTLFWGVLASVLYSFQALSAGGHDLISMTHSYNTHAKLKPIHSSEEYKIAKTRFLPDFEDSDYGWGGKEITSKNYTPVSIDGCSSYPLSSCPNKGICSKCPFDGSKHKLDSCSSGWYKSGDMCCANDCASFGDVNSVSNNKVCTGYDYFPSGCRSFICYTQCRNVSCSGYPIDCSATIANATSRETCPDCISSGSTAVANCSPQKCKITACANGYKVNSNASGCVEKDDTCPTGYYKSCETGTTGDPKYTEKGTACYQCKASTPSCTSAYLCDCCSTPYCNGRDNNAYYLADMGFLPAVACNQLASNITNTNGTISKWYLPAAGEYAEIFSHIDLINEALANVGNRFKYSGQAEELSSNGYYTSTATSSSMMYTFVPYGTSYHGSGLYNDHILEHNAYFQYRRVRCFNKFTVPSGTFAYPGYVLADGTIGDPTTMNIYYSVQGVVVKQSGDEVTVMTIRDLRFSSPNTANNSIGLGEGDINYTNSFPDNIASTAAFNMPGLVIGKEDSCN